MPCVVTPTPFAISVTMVTIITLYHLYYRDHSRIVAMCCHPHPPRHKRYHGDCHNILLFILQGSFPCCCHLSSMVNKPSLGVMVTPYIRMECYQLYTNQTSCSLCYSTTRHSSATVLRRPLSVYPVPCLNLLQPDLAE